MEGTDDSRTTNASDGATESAVLGQLFDLHPTQVTVAELVREIGGEQADFGERDAIERASVIWAAPGSCTATTTS